MLTPYVPVLILAVIAAGFALLVLGASAVIGPRAPSEAKRAPYESGLVPIGPARRRVPIRFYLVSTLFILFEIEVVYLYPWAVRFRELARPEPEGIGLRALWSVGLFVGVLFIGFVHVWRKGALEWK